ncbi:MAG: hypothetical protein EBS29_05185 [Chloroflexia bacterium]|nr:hypothetical protein [Chloroflexia bacterium]
MDGARVGAAEMMEFCHTWLRGQQQGLDAQYGLSHCEWQLSQDDKLVTYRRHGSVVAVAPFTMIGSFCAHNGTWLWAWANPAIHRDITMNQQQTVACMQQIGMTHLARPVIQVDSVPSLWQGRVHAAAYEQRMQTAILRLVSIAAYSLGGMGVQSYVNHAQRVMGWVVLNHVYLPVDSV